MPQFEPWSYASQIFWLLITFGILMVLMAKVALPKVSEVLDERQKRIDDNLDKAQQLKAEAEAAVKEYERALEEARNNAKARIQETRDRLAEESHKRHEELAARLETEIAEGEDRIARAIRLRFDIPNEVPAGVEEIIKRADKGAAFLEATQLAGFAPGEARHLFGRPQGIHDLTLDPVPPQDAKARFLARFSRLRPG